MVLLRIKEVSSEDGGGGNDVRKERDSGSLSTIRLQQSGKTWTNAQTSLSRISSILFPHARPLVPVRSLCSWNHIPLPIVSERAYQYAYPNIDPSTNSIRKNKYVPPCSSSIYWFSPEPCVNGSLAFLLATR